MASPLPDELQSLVDELTALRSALLAAERAHGAAIAESHPHHRRSAANLVHYVELRRHDIRSLQTRLSALGLSSLGRSEAHVLASVDAVISVVGSLLGRQPSGERSTEIGIGEGDEMLAANADSLLGRQSATRLARIMVTLPSQAADDRAFCDDLTAAGMDLARINCAHDDADAWKRMIGNVRDGRADHAPLVAIDLAGPKLRTVALDAGPPVVRVRPRRDAYGRVVAPAEIRLVAESGEAPTGDAPIGDAGDDGDHGDHGDTITVDDAEWLGRRTPGEVIELVDTRGSSRRWTVMERSGDDVVVATSKTTYLTNGTALTCPTDPVTEATYCTGIAPTDRSHRVFVGDEVVLVPADDDTDRADPPHPTDRADPPEGTVTIGVSLPELFTTIAVDDPIWFDDGRIGGTVRRTDANSITVEVTDVGPGGAPLKSGKGINVPNTDLAVSPLTAKDLADLDLLAGEVDVVSLSFVRGPDDVARLQRELRRRGALDVGIVLKIENVRAFTNLPQLLLQAMTWERVGVMIARGDLAVEVGFERLAEVQEEVMWACEAAHVPVIWATQVLESLAKRGRPSRAEVTDAAMAVRAECVMLNKGPHVLAAMSSLDTILSRMGEHQRKKRSMLRRLTSWDHDVGDRPIDEPDVVDGGPELGEGLSTPR